MSGLLAVDPGLDQFGWAHFATEGPRCFTYQQVQARLLASGSEKTDPADSLPLRLILLTAGLRKVLEETRAKYVAIEKPAVGFTYRRHQKLETGQGFIGETMAQCYLATGALMVAAAELIGPGNVVQQHAGRIKKEQRADLLYALWPGLRNRQSNQDQRDAVYLGLQAMLDSRRTWNGSKAPA